MIELRVDVRATVGFLGSLFKWLAVPLSFPLVLAVVYGEPVAPFAVTIAITLGVGLALEWLRDEAAEETGIGTREGYLLVALAWLIVAVVGAIPFVLSGQGVLANPIDALFESTSGITTTGATVLVDFETHSRAILLWRQLLQWLGGLGILVLAISVFSQLSIAGAQLMEMETQTKTVQKLEPRIEQTARLLWKLYAGITGLCALSLYGLHLAGVAPGMDAYNAVAHAMSGVATAGFSPAPESLGGFAPAAQWTLVPFMFLGATNFILIYHFVRGDLRGPLENEEFRFYAGIVAGTTVLLSLLLFLDPTVGLPAEATLRHAAFQVVSIMTTTGFASIDYNVWSPAAKHLLFALMFLGGMVGSTTCSIKLLRWLVVLKAFRRELYAAVHPDAIRPVRLGGSAVDERSIQQIYLFTLASLLLFFAGATFVAVEGHRSGLGLTEFEAMGAAAATFFNVGPAFGIAGPYETYAVFSDATKVVMIVLMWVGRIEIIPVLVLLTRDYWRG